MFITDSVASNKPETPVLDVYKEGVLLPVLKGEDIFSSGRYALFIKQLRGLVDVDSTYFAALYEPLIFKFSQFVQALPAQPYGPLYGLLNCSLVRALSALQQFVLHSSEQEAKPIYRYAVFSAALLLDISKVVTQQKIMVTDDEGHYIEDWMPHLGEPLIAEGLYYRFYFYTAAYHRLDNSLVVMLAKHTMPQVGYEWLSSDFKVFADWMDALQGNSSHGGRITQVLDHLPLEHLDKLLRSLGHLQIDMIEPGDQLGNEFYHWLKSGIADGSIKINEKNALVHVVNEGVLVEKQLFKQFGDFMKVPINNKVLHRQVGNLLGIVSKGSGDYLFEKYFGSGAHAGKRGFGLGVAAQSGVEREGIVIVNSSLLIMNAELSSVSDLEAANQAAHDLPSLANKSNPNSPEANPI